MAKRRYRTGKEKEALLKKGLIIFAAVFVGVVVLVTAAGLVWAGISDHLLRLQLQYDYFTDPWDGEGRFSFLSKKGEVWLYYEGLMRVEDDAVESGGTGVVYDLSAGKMLCVDTEKIEKEETRKAVEKMYADYAERKGLSFRTGSLEKLKEEGMIDKSVRDTYTEGCLLQLHENQWDSEHKYFSVHMFFYYNNTYGQGATVAVASPKNWKELREELDPGDREGVSDDGEWISVITSTIMS